MNNIKHLKALTSSLILFSVSLLVVLSLDTLAKVFALDEWNLIYELVIIEKLLTSGNYISIVLLMIVEAALISWTCPDFFKNMNLRTKFLIYLFLFVFGIWLISSKNNIIAILIGLMLVSLFTLIIGFMMFNDCNTKKNIKKLNIG